MLTGAAQLAGEADNAGVAGSRSACVLPAGQFVLDVAESTSGTTPSDAPLYQLALSADGRQPVAVPVKPQRTFPAVLRPSPPVARPVIVRTRPIRRVAVRSTRPARQSVRRRCTAPARLAEPHEPEPALAGLPVAA